MTWRVLASSAFLPARTLADVLRRQKFSERLALADTSVEEIVFGYAALAKTIRPHKIQPVITADPDDDKDLACAQTANAEVIVSGNSHLLDLNEFEGIKIITVNQLLDEYS